MLSVLMIQHPSCPESHWAFAIGQNGGGSRDEVSCCALTSVSGLRWTSLAAGGGRGEQGGSLPARTVSPSVFHIVVHASVSVRCSLQSVSG